MDHLNLVNCTPLASKPGLFSSLGPSQSFIDRNIFPPLYIFSEITLLPITPKQITSNTRKYFL